MASKVAEEIERLESELESLAKASQGGASAASSDVDGVAVQHLADSHDEWQIIKASKDLFNSNHADIAPLMVSSGCARIVLDAMERESVNIDMQIAGCEFISDLSAIIDKQDTGKLVEVGCLRAVLDAFAAHPNHPQLFLFGMESLRVLVRDTPAADITPVLDVGTCCRALTNLMRAEIVATEIDPKVFLSCCKLIRLLLEFSLEHHGIEVIGESDCFTQMCKNLRAHPMDFSIQSIGIQVLFRAASQSGVLANYISGSDLLQVWIGACAQFPEHPSLVSPGLPFVRQFFEAGLADEVRQQLNPAFLIALYLHHQNLIVLVARCLCCWEGEEVEGPSTFTVALGMLADCFARRPCYALMETEDAQNQAEDLSGAKAAYPELARPLPHLLVAIEEARGEDSSASRALLATKEETIEGEWNLGTIKNGVLTFGIGRQCPLLESSSTSFTINYRGSDLSATYQPDGTLLWSSGTIWHRADKASAPSEESLILVASRPGMNHFEKMGIYVKIGASRGSGHRRHPIYQALHRPLYLYYWEESGNWKVGPDYTDSLAYIISPNDERPESPTHVDAWYVCSKDGVLQHEEITVTQVPTCDAAQVERLFDVVAAMRYTPRMFFMNFVGPITDVLLDVKMVTSFAMNGQWSWTGAIASAMFINGATCGTIHIMSGNLILGVVDILSFGSAGMLKATVASIKTGIRHEDVGLHCLCESFESSVSLLVCASSIISAGTIKGVRELCYIDTITRWPSFILSGLLLAQNAVDLSKKHASWNIDGCSFWHPVVRTLTGKIPIFMFQFTECVGNLCVVVVAWVYYPHGALAAVGFCTVWFAFVAVRFMLHAYKRVEAEHTNIGVNHDQTGFNFWTGIFPPSLLSGALYSFTNVFGLSDTNCFRPVQCPHGHLLVARQNIDGCGHRCASCSSKGRQLKGFGCYSCKYFRCNACYRSVRPSAGAGFEADVAYSRPLFWAVAWAIIFWRLRQHQDRLGQIQTAPNVTAMFAVIATSSLVHTLLIVEQFWMGRWSTARSESRSSNVEESALST